MDQSSCKPSPTPQMGGHTPPSNPRANLPTKMGTGVPPPNPTNHAETTDKFSRLTHSILYQFITGHAFTGEYRFFSRHMSEQIACPCGEPVQTIEHILMKCTLWTAARQKHFTTNGRLRSLP